MRELINELISSELLKDEVAQVSLPVEMETYQKPPMMRNM